jgi:hypothetical protein
MSSSPTRSSSARRNAEAQKREASFKLDQEREGEAMAQKTARLRELRLAKEAADKAAEVSDPPVAKPAKPRRARQT